MTARSTLTVAALGLLLAVLLAVAGASRGEDETRQKASSGYAISDHHARLHFECRDCHGRGSRARYKPLVAEDCLQCHGSYELVADRTADLGYYENIHAAPHYPRLECTLCHQEHGEIKRNYCAMYDRECESENFCVMCHSQDAMLELRVP